MYMSLVAPADQARGGAVGREIAGEIAQSEDVAAMQAAFDGLSDDEDVIEQKEAEQQEEEQQEEEQQEEEQQEEEQHDRGSNDDVEENSENKQNSAEEQPGENDSDGAQGMQEPGLCPADKGYAQAWFNYKISQKHYSWKQREQLYAELEQIELSASSGRGTGRKRRRV
jgi:cobalamin biosynthesis protein CobT